MEKLQERIDEYNKITKDLVTKIKASIDEINNGIKINSESFSDFEFKYLQYLLIELYQHNLRVEAFCNGCTTVNSMLQFSYEPLLREIIPPFETDWNDCVVDTYELSYDNSISSIVHIK